MPLQVINIEDKVIELEDNVIEMTNNLVENVENLRLLIGRGVPVAPPNVNKIANTVNTFNECYKNNDYAIFEQSLNKNLKIISYQESLCYSDYDKPILSEIKKIEKLYAYWTNNISSRVGQNLVYTILDNWLENTYADSLITLQNTVNTIFGLNQNLRYQKFNDEKEFIDYKVSLKKIYKPIPLEGKLNLLIDKGFDKSRILLSQYYKKLLFNYVKDIYNIDNKEILNNFINRLKEINNQELTTICLCKAILEIENTKKYRNQETFKTWAMMYIGDPIKDTNWTVNSVEIQLLSSKYVQKSREILKKWINKVFIATFFQTMSASERGDFWLNYVDEIKDIQMIGGKIYLRKMSKQTPSAKTYLEKRYQNTDDTNVACIKMYFTNHVIVLFSDAGYAAICKKGDVDRVNRRITELRDGQVPFAFTYRNGYVSNIKKEGRLRHTDGWEKAFRKYLKEVVI